MSTEESKEDVLAKSEDKVAHGSKTDIEQPKNMPLDSTVAGSGDHVLANKTTAMTSDDIPDELDENPTEISIEIGQGDHSKESDHSNSKDKCEPRSNIPLSDSNVRPPIEGDMEETAKSTSLENVSSLEDFDNDNQDEELILKWDDDEDDRMPSPDDDIDKNVDTDTKTRELKVTDESENISNEVSDSESKISKDNADDDDEDDLLSEIDAQIMELGASLSKAENEGLINSKKAVESKVIIDSTSIKTEISEPSIQNVVIDISEKPTELASTTKINLDQEHCKKEPIAINESANKLTSNIEKLEMEIEEALLKDTENISQIDDDLDSKDKLNQKESIADTNLHSPKAEIDITNDELKQIDSIADSDLVSEADVGVNVDSPVDLADVNSDESNQIISKSSEIEMEVDTSDNLEGGNLTLDQDKEENVFKKTDILANSSKLDNSELETSCKGDNFAHDSSISFEEQHGVNKPNVMLEIPTQELIDLDVSEFSSQDEETCLDEQKIEEPSIPAESKDDIISDLETGIANKDRPTKDIEETQTDKMNENQSIDVTTQQTLLETEHTISDKNSTPLKLPVDGRTPEKNTSLLKDTIIANTEDKQETPLEDTVKSSNDNQITEENTSTADVEMKSPVESNVVEEQHESLDQALEESNTDQIPQISSTIPSKDDTPAKENQMNSPKATKDDQTNLPAEMNDSAIDHETKECLPDDMSSIKVNDSTNATADSMEVQPSTTKMALRLESVPSDDAAESTDSLGLLAESSRVRDEDDGDADADDGDADDADADAEETSDHDDDEDDFYPDDESSNQLTAEHSEDSTPNSESESNKPQEIEPDTATDNDKAFDIIVNEDKTNADTFGLAIDNDNTADNTADNIAEEDIDKETGEVNSDVGKEFGFQISNIVSEETKEDGEMDIDDDIVCEEVEVSSDLIEDTERTDEVDITALKSKDQEIPFKVHTESKLRELLQTNKIQEVKSPLKKLEIAQPKHVVSIVDLESSSEDESPKSEPQSSPAGTQPLPPALTSVNISGEIEVMSSGDRMSEIISKEGETVINVPRTPILHKITSRLNTSEITIKTGASAESTLVIPEIGTKEPRHKFGALEVFNLDSDDEDTPAPPLKEATPEPEPDPKLSRPPTKCINSACVSDPSTPFHRAAPALATYFESRKKKLGMVCQDCLVEYLERAQKLVEGAKSFTPLLAMEEVRCSQELVEISDSDEDEEASGAVDEKDRIGAEIGGELERQLVDMINATWDKFHMDERLKEAQDQLTDDLQTLERESAEVNQLLDSCQLATDRLRSELYASFSVRRQQLQGFIIHDTPDKYFMCPEPSAPEQEAGVAGGKRRLSAASDSAPKRHQADRGDGDKLEESKPDFDSSKLDDDKDISVVTLSAEAAPADLPAPGDLQRAPLQTGQVVYAMRNAFGSWIEATILEVTPKGTSANAMNFTMCRIKFENKSCRNAYKLLPARCLAYFTPASARMTIGTRVIALFKDTSLDKSGKRESYYSGVVAEMPNPVNKYRYLIFFDDGYAQYVSHSDTRLVCEFSALVWEEVHPYSREFVREYLLAYPERPMVRLHTGQSIKTEWNGKWWLSKVTQVDASLVQVYFEHDKRTEWIYRGSTRLAPLFLELQAAEKHRARPMPRNRVQNKLNMPYVEYTRDEQQDAAKAAEAQAKAQQEEIRRQRAVAKKSTTPHNLPPQQTVTGNLDAVTSRVVYYTPKNAVKPYKMAAHTCGLKCKRTDVLALKDLRTYNPLAKPLLSGWERQIVRYKGHKEVMYRAPCGRRLRNMAELHQYLRLLGSDMGVDLFDFGPNTHCLAEFVLNKCIVGKKDLSHGKENVPVPCVNYYDESLPEFCSYNTERTPTAGVPLNLDPEFLCGCDCTDDCRDKSKCACWKMTLEGARTIGMDPARVGYVYKRLPNPLPSGIYECNSRCKCKSTCLNRVAQHPLQLKLQVFKTLNRGWGIRALNDVPKGSFLCIYAGNLLTDDTANMDGLNEGDEYLAELDYIEVVEQMKEGYEDDIPDADKKLDRKDGKESKSETESEESEEEAANSKSDADDGDFEPGYVPGGIQMGFNKRLRKRDKKKQKSKEDEQKAKEGGTENEEDCITISDDEELREPSSFAAQAGMGGQLISKYKSVRTLFGKDEACYIMDAKVQGNIGRYLNHSCSPNVFVQNVFVDSHDPRFPWVAFFALTHIRAGTELTWNYNYDIGSVPGKVLYCYCGAPNCRGRLL